MSIRPKEDKTNALAMPLRHIRVGVIRASRTIGTHYNKPGSPGRTLCGGEMTAQDWSVSEAWTSTKKDKDKFNVCKCCLAKV